MADNVEQMYRHLVRTIRTRYPRVHVWIGRVYLICVGVSALAGFFFAQSSIAGITGVLGFGALAVSWFVSGLLARLPS